MTLYHLQLVTIMIVALFASFMTYVFTVDASRCIAPVESFTVDERGEVVGSLQSGVTFTMKQVITDTDVRLMRFQMENAHWYVSDKGIIEAENDLKALSIYMTLD